ncbi:hypothetical protein [Streptomyces clavuligerus]|uniref:hypothetical protein n=1 Tax=Streptomyces clavuligerus TaxID=1901 RepID=UPI0001851F6F|nr:hypothetical protein [Streptomyces clavuligerus]WDN56060.1 hypothetical protein LL058_29730 [Streptomyces clavuligerus]
MTTSARSDLPARRRRHARLIAALTALIAGCAEAAGAVYQPLAAADPDQDGVAVDLMPIMRLAAAAPTLLDRARDEDIGRWPAAVAREQAESRRTCTARCTIAAAHDLLDEPGPAGPVPLPTAGQGAAMNLASAGDEVAAHWRLDPDEAIVLVHELADSGAFTLDEVLDSAVDATVAVGVLALAQAADIRTDPSLAAETCLSAVPYLAQAVALAVADLD